MPAQPAWFSHLPAILTQLAELDCEYLDRQAVERIFGVGERRARQLMAGLPALQVGNAVAVSRSALLERMRSTLGGARFQWEAQRRRRVSSFLQEARKHAAAASVALPVPRSGAFADLSADIVLDPGELRVRFVGAEDLAAKLYALAQAMAEDWGAFEKRLL